jgi:enoyl-CoA hydratase/carnithine racemase
MDYSSFEHLLVDIDDLGVATLTLNRPEKLNAFNWKMEREFGEAVRALDADEAVKVIVITGAGRGFCSGVDLSEGAQGAFSADARAAHEAETGTKSEDLADKFGFWRMATPIIGAIHGAAVGAGLTLTLLFDIRVVAEDAKLEFIFPRRALIPDANATWLLPRLIGLSRALDLMITGRRFNGVEAVEYGLATRAVPADDVLAAAQALAREIAVKCSPATMGLVKRMLYTFAKTNDRDEAFRQETELIWWIGQQPDVIAGVMGWLHDKDPEWKLPKYPELPGNLRFLD